MNARSVSGVNHEFVGSRITSADSGAKEERVLSAGIRTAGPRAEFRLWGRRGQSQLKLFLAASTTLIGGPAELEVLFAQEGAEPGSLGMIQIPWEEWAVQSLPCSVEGSGPLTFVLQTHTVAVPHAVLHNGDHRELGVHLAAAHLC